MSNGRRNDDSEFLSNLVASLVVGGIVLSGIKSVSNIQALTPTEFLIHRFPIALVFSVFFVLVEPKFMQFIRWIMLGIGLERRDRVIGFSNNVYAGYVASWTIEFLIGGIGAITLQFVECTFVLVWVGVIIVYFVPS
jgi:hypothetical protein